MSAEGPSSGAQLLVIRRSRTAKDFFGLLVKGARWTHYYTKSWWKEPLTRTKMEGLPNPKDCG